MFVCAFFAAGLQDGRLAGTCNSSNPADPPSVDWHSMPDSDIEKLLKNVLQASQQDAPGRYYLFVLPTIHREVLIRLTIGAGRAGWVVAGPQAQATLHQALTGQEAAAAIATTFASLTCGCHMWKAV